MPRMMLRQLSLSFPIFHRLVSPLFLVHPLSPSHLLQPSHAPAIMQRRAVHPWHVGRVLPCYRVERCRQKPLSSAPMLAQSLFSVSPRLSSIQNAQRTNNCIYSHAPAFFSASTAPPSPPSSLPSFPPNHFLPLFLPSSVLPRIARQAFLILSRVCSRLQCLASSSRTLLGSI